MVDTPGIGSIYRHNTEVTRRFLPRADAVLFLLSVDQRVGQAEHDFLVEVREYAGRVVFLLNKADLFDETELTESESFTHGVLEEAMGGPVMLFPVSALLARQAPGSGGFAAFTEALERFLMNEKSDALAAALAKGLLRHVNQTRFNTELTLSGLDTPAETMPGKVAAFESRRKQIAQEKCDFTVLLRAEGKQLADGEVTADVEAFTTRLTAEVEAQVRADFAAQRGPPLGQLAETLQHGALECLRSGWDRFRKAEDGKLETAFQGIVDRFGDKIDATVDEL